MSDLTSIPALFMRGGTSSGPFWNAKDLPEDVAARDRVLLAALGSNDGVDQQTMDAGQLNGVGGGTTVTSKTAVLSKSDVDGIDVDYLFAQVDFTRPYVDTAPSCGNILSAVGHAALEMGLVDAQDPVTSIMIRNVNTGGLMEAVLETPGGVWSYLGDARIDGVVGRGAPVVMNFLDVIGSKTGAMFPTQKRQEEINGLTVTLMDVAVPMIWFKAEELGLEGNESKAALDDPELIARMEACRLIASERMGLGDARGSVVPKMGIASKPRQDGTITSRYFVPQNCHPTHAVTGAICVAVASAEPGTVVNEAAAAEDLSSQMVKLEHPSGTMNVSLTYEEGAFKKAGVIRTARKIMSGDIWVPSQAL